MIRFFLKHSYLKENRFKKYSQICVLLSGLLLMISCQGGHTPQPQISQGGESANVSSMTPLMSMGEFVKYRYIPVGTAVGESCGARHIGISTYDDRGSYLGAVKRAVDSKNGDILANPVVEEYTDRKWLFFWKKCTQVFGIVLKIDVQNDEKNDKQVKKMGGTQATLKDEKTDFVKISARQDTEVTEVTIDKFTSGMIVDISSGKNLGGKLDEVVLDKGKLNGIWTGDKFIIRKNSKSDYRKAVPRHGTDEVVGFMKIVSAYDNTSIGVITNSSEEVAKGDLVESLKE